jgi:hypothetical protein
MGVAGLRSRVSVEAFVPAALLPGAAARVATDAGARVLFERHWDGVLAVASAGEPRWLARDRSVVVKRGLPLPDGLAPGVVRDIALDFDLGRYARDFGVAALPEVPDLDSQVAAGLFEELAGGSASFVRLPPGLEADGMLNLDVSSGAVGLRQPFRFDGSKAVVDHHFSRGERSALAVLDREFRGVEVPGQALELAHTEAEHRALLSGDVALGLAPYLEPRLVLLLAREGALLEPVSRLRGLDYWGPAVDRALAARDAALRAPVRVVGEVALVGPGGVLAGFASGASAVVEVRERGGGVFVSARSVPGRALPGRLVSALASLPGVRVGPDSSFAACAGSDGRGIPGPAAEVAAQLARGLEGRGLERGPVLERGREF